MDRYKIKQGKNTILIADDDIINREVLKNIFSSQYSFKEAENGIEALEIIEKNSDKLCAVILDIQMPKMDGMEALRILSEKGITEKIPTFLITMFDEKEFVEEAYSLGVMDVVSKPVTAVIIKRRVETVIELFTTRETLSDTIKGQAEKLSENAETIEDLHRGTIETLAAAIEFRDVESGHHTSRIYDMTKYMLTHTEIGRGMSSEEIENISKASIMHDLGKIAVSDMILKKPGRLTAEEFEIMKLHTVKGAELLTQISKLHDHDLYKIACDIARHHHERWDGKGYPDGLKGDEISVASQVVSIVDVYDALVSERVYKKSFLPDEAVYMIKDGQCGKFNPKLLDCFLKIEPEIRNWYNEDKNNLSESKANADNLIAEKKEQLYVTNELSNVMLLMAAVKSAFDLIIFVNLTKNTYYMVDYERFLNHTERADGVLDELIEDATSTIPEAFRQQFIECFSRPYLLKAYEDGKRSVSLDHMQMGDDGKLHWMRTSVLLMENSVNDDVLEITLSQCIDDEIAEKERTKNLITDALKLAEQLRRNK